MGTARSLAPQEARERAEAAARLLARDARVILVYAFGSAVASRPGLIRDVDVAVLTDPPLALTELTSLRADVVLAIGAPIDLVSLNDASVVLASEVVESGTCLFARAPEAETDFVCRTRVRFLDFRPYLEEQWRLTGMRLEERARGT